IYLPRTSAKPAQGNTSTFPTEVGGTDATILIAEDEPVLRSLTAMILRRYGYRVLEAEDGMEALRIAREQGFAIDLLLTDLVMPRLGGQPLAAQLLDHSPGLKVVFMSGYAEEVVTRQG